MSVTAVLTMWQGHAPLPGRTSQHSHEHSPDRHQHQLAHVCIHSLRCGGHERCQGPQGCQLLLQLRAVSDHILSTS